MCANRMAGPSGVSVREISKLTGADIKSWTNPAGGSVSGRPARAFNVEVCHFNVQMQFYFIAYHYSTSLSYCTPL